MLPLNAKTSELLSLLATIDPVDPGMNEVRTIWVPVAEFHSFMAVYQTGQLDSNAELTAKIMQAFDSVGTGSKEISGKTYSQILDSTQASARQIIINLKTEELDIEDGYGWIGLSLSAPFGSGGLVSAQLWGIPHSVPADAFNTSTVLSVI